MEIDLDLVYLLGGVAIAIGGIIYGVLKKSLSNGNGGNIFVDNVLEKLDKMSEKDTVMLVSLEKINRDLERILSKLN